MRTTLELLNKVVEMGFEKERALKDIDAALDKVIGFKNRKELKTEKLSEELYSDILFGFECELENI